MLKWKWKEAVLFDIIFCFIVMNVHCLNYISAAINIFKWKWKEAVVFDIFCLIVNTVRKIAVAKASWLTLSSTLLFAELPDLCRPIRGSSHFLVEIAKSELPRMQVLAYLVLRNARRPTSPDYLPNLLGTLDRNGNSESNRSGGKKVPGTNCSW